ncbi:hypothetical protein HY357_00605 [Candidatus Roizmanbacteria bacterium]|nr:hypothetical protein [Candidatus Roizmanbacteria bacterium]
MGIKERRTKILLALVLLSDVNLSSVDLGPTAQMIFDITFNQKTRGSISGLVREELIEKVDGQEEAASDLTNRYKLTDKGFFALCLEFPYFRFLKDKWDEKWRVLSYEIPEKKRELRDKLRREVSGWGLGPWHRSFWLTPHPIIENLRQLVSQKEEEKYIQAFESEHVFGDREILIEKVWQKSILDKHYRDLFKTWHDILAGEAEKKEKFKKVIEKFVDVLKNDPGLPKELVGSNWIGFEAFNIFKEIRSILLS